ncbi:Cytochrome c-type biogenesis protein CcmE [Marinomonas spartinae]|uniref:Cytochrome c-type biogenesis protein CcmE n=1 Tax=Marinomonas spartinae TaxID=1792290 RepID=A0A1A8TH33_9GAMM|nr:cytochrome c maturation protein CcmE [Marinomonas spartinae]SBS26545.1 Cytochrome c-type biogenesis protein CcmE [Marinomonas spartinae]SBS32826.1 Cytochrome c-type biogenesis protein CcmE [Marinomonas spartinae]
MHPIRRKRIITIAIIVLVLSGAIGLVLYALQQNINLFYTPTQIASGEAPKGVNIRAGGMVVKGSVKRDSNTLFVSFNVTDFKRIVHIEYHGILPDLFREGQGIVAQGKLLPNGTFLASQVLAKHDEKYMPPDVANALKQAKGNTPSKPYNDN